MTDTGLATRTLGRTGLAVTRLGYGAMSLDDGRLTPVTPEQAREVLNALLDGGINFIDTSPDYGGSEEAIGAYIAHRRSEYFLASKCGCPVAVQPEPGQPPQHVYTRENIIAGVEQSLRRMKTDYLDLVEFHGTPSRGRLEREGSIEALRELQQQGKVRFIGASTTLPQLPAVIEMGVFDAFQIPYSALQRDHEAWISTAAAAHAGTIIRGGVARGGPAPDKGWDTRRLPEVAPEVPRQLWEQAGLDDLLEGRSRMEFMLRFTLSHPDVHTAIVGTANADHLRANIEAARKGPLHPGIRDEAIRRLESLAPAGATE